MSLNPALFSSKASDWETPPELFVALDQEFCFTLDAAANERNHKCDKWYGPGGIAEDTLTARWFGSVYMNPPYGKHIAKFVAKAYDEARKGHCDVVVALLPARTDTAWWHRYVMQAGEIRLLQGRLRFVGAPYPAPFPSCIAIWRPSDPRNGEPVVRSWNWKGRGNLH